MGKPHISEGGISSPKQEDAVLRSDLIDLRNAIDTLIKDRLLASAIEKDEYGYYVIKEEEPIGFARTAQSLSNVSQRILLFMDMAESYQGLAIEAKNTSSWKEPLKFGKIKANQAVILKDLGFLLNTLRKEMKGIKPADNNWITQDSLVGFKK